MCIEPTSLFFYEHVTAAGGRSGTSTHLMREALALADAVLEDLDALGFGVITLRDVDLPAPPGNAHLEWAEGVSNDHLLELAGKTDQSLILAPETDGVLHACIQMLHRHGIPTHNADPASIALCADKLTLAEHLRGHNIPTPPTYRDRAEIRARCIVKPRDGAGCMQTYRLDAGESAPSHIPNPVYQPEIRGIPVSVLFHADPRSGIRAFAPSVQHIDRSTSRLQYQGNHWPIDAELAVPAIQCAEQALHAIPGLRGFIGVDLIICPQTHEPTLIEINPRLTSSYLALRRLCSANLMQLLFDPHVLLHFDDGPYELALRQLQRTHIAQP